MEASCISFDSYIKPQRKTIKQNKQKSCISFDSYIKPQLHPYSINTKISCISFDSYIKPQLEKGTDGNYYVVYLLIPTSNHNL